MNTYTNNVLEMLNEKYPWEKEYIQSVSEVFKSIAPVLDSNLEYQNNRILEQLVEPDRSISFRVPWRDDQGRKVYRGGSHSKNLTAMIPVNYEGVFRKFLKSGTLPGPSGGVVDNPYKAAAEILAESELSNTDRFYLWNLTGRVKPFIMKYAPKEKGKKWVVEHTPIGGDQWVNDETVTFYVKGEYELMYALWWHGSVQIFTTA